MSIQSCISKVKPRKGANDIDFSETLNTLYYRQRISPDKIDETLQAHSEGVSLRGIRRQTKLVYNSVVAIIRDASENAQLFHNDAFNYVETEQIDADEIWSFVQKSKT